MEWRQGAQGGLVSRDGEQIQGRGGGQAAREGGPQPEEQQQGGQGRRAGRQKQHGPTWSTKPALRLITTAHREWLVAMAVTAGRQAGRQTGRQQHQVKARNNLTSFLAKHSCHLDTNQCTRGRAYMRR